MRHILLVDISQSQIRALEHMLRDNLGYRLTRFEEESEEALSLLFETGATIPELILMDGSEPQKAKARIRSLRRLRADLPIVLIMITEADGARDMIKAGATDFLIRPVSVDRLRLTLSRILEVQDLRQALRRLEDELAQPLSHCADEAASPGMRNVCELALQAAATRMPVWIEGEEGTGKTSLAYMIHRQKHPDTAWVRVNCRAEDEILDRALFGREGEVCAFISAKGGTLLLDDVDAMPPAIQARLVTKLAESLQADGSAAGARVIATSRHALREGGIAGFHPQLFQQLGQRPIHLPALRYRREDIPTLSQRLLIRHALREGRPAREFSSEARVHLMRAPWSRNLRELNHTLWRAAMLADGPVVEVAHFDSAHHAPIKATIHNAFASHAPAWRESSALQLAVTDSEGNIKRIEDIELELIQLALKHYNGHMSEVAKRLGIGRSTLYRKLQDPEPVQNEPVVSVQRMS